MLQPKLRQPMEKLLEEKKFVALVNCKVKARKFCPSLEITTSQATSGEFPKEIQDRGAADGCWRQRGVNGGALLAWLPPNKLRYRGAADGCWHQLRVDGGTLLASLSPNKIGTGKSGESWRNGQYQFKGNRAPRQEQLKIALNLIAVVVLEFSCGKQTWGYCRKERATDWKELW